MLGPTLGPFLQGESEDFRALYARCMGCGQGTGLTPASREWALLSAQES